MIRAMLRAIVRNIAKKGGRELQTVRPFSIIVLWTKMSRGKGIYLCGGVPHRQDFICAVECRIDRIYFVRG